MAVNVSNEDMEKIDNAAFPAVAADAAGSTVLREKTRALLAGRLDKILPAYFQQ